MADPVSPLLADAVEQAAKAEGIAATRGGTYLVMEGPQFSTRAESNLYRSWGCAVIGMTNMPEAKLAREAEICYATVAMVTDYDCWHHEHADVDVAEIIKVLTANVDKAHAPDRAAGARLPARAPALPGRLRPRAGGGDHHAARGARPGAGGQARRGGGPCAAASLSIPEAEASAYRPQAEAIRDLSALKLSTPPGIPIIKGGGPRLCAPDLDLRSSPVRCGRDGKP